jgi:pSer/pThr/pTyr-binding forkhead associated (FHA) protein
MKVVLELQDQPSNVRRITIRHDIVIGRGSDCNLRLSAPQVSRRHCFLRVGRDSVSVTDLDSSNGTFVDGRRLHAGKRCEISDGAQLALGPIRFVVHVRAEAVVTESDRRKAAARIGSEYSEADSGHYSAEPPGLNDDSVTADGRSQGTGSAAAMDYSIENGGESAEPHAATAGHLENSVSVSGEATELDPDPMDSRLEIIDFGRLVSDDRSNEEETRAVSLKGISEESEKVEDREPQWKSAIMDSTEFPDDIDVLSMADDSNPNFRLDNEETSLTKDSRSPASEEIADVEVVPERQESPNLVGDVSEVNEEFSWFSDDEVDEPSQTADSDSAASFDIAEDADDDEFDPDRQNSRKGI